LSFPPAVRKGGGKAGPPAGNARNRDDPGKSRIRILFFSPGDEFAPDSRGPETPPRKATPAGTRRDPWRASFRKQFLFPRRPGPQSRENGGNPVRIIGDERDRPRKPDGSVAGFPVASGSDAKPEKSKRERDPRRVFGNNFC
jgi:hypothetical protein